MAENEKSSSAELELKRLEKRLEELIATVHRLKDENRSLRARVEAMIGRLKAMERTA